MPIAGGVRRSPAELASEPVELAVILAAGEGSRLARHGNAQPKPTVSLLGLSLGERTVLSCMEAGIQRFLVVLGHEKEQVQAHFERIAAARACEILFVEGSDWQLGNGASGLAAAQAVGDRRFVLCMVDHLLDPELIQAVRSAVICEGEIGLGVDRDRDRLFDPHDATKVTLGGDRVTQIGKQLDKWDAADTGVFLCTRALFKDLAAAAARGRHGLSDGVATLARRGAVRAIDVTGLGWLDVDTPEAWHEARRRLLSSLSGKGEDGLISRLINRPISTRISAWLSSTSITPNQVTLAGFSMCLVGAAFLAIGERALTIAGGLVVQASSILDGCDGEIARLKHRATPRGAWLDTIADRYGDLAVAVAITLAHARSHPSPLVWLGGMMALAGFVLASYTTKEYGIRHGYPYPDDILNRLKRRDLRLLVICVAAVVGYPYAGVLAVGLLSHACVFGILVRGSKIGSRGTGSSGRPPRGWPRRLR
jgi:CDP-L-myo-inositol myo-inositolphosphotransferase